MFQISQTTTTTTRMLCIMLSNNNLPATVLGFIHQFYTSTHFKETMQAGATQACHAFTTEQDLSSTQLTAVSSWQPEVTVWSLTAVNAFTERLASRLVVSVV